MTSILDRIIAWANADSNVRALVQVGSRAGNEPTDDLADNDLQVYAKTTRPYVQDNRWLSTFAPVWVCVHDEYRHGNLTVPTRLVIFEGGTKVDFALYPAEVAIAMDPGEPVCRVLVDKDNMVPDLRRPRTPAEPPSEAEFLRIVEEFWFEAYHVAKYLARGELWPAKARDWETKAFLLKMIAWHADARQGWDVDTHPGGKHLRSWAGSDVWMGLQHAFSHFDAEDSWRGLNATTALFRRLAKETAVALRMAYPDDVDQHLSGLPLRSPYTFEAVRDIMARCHGALILAFARWRDPSGGDRVTMSTVWNHFEGAFALAMNKELLEFIEKRI